MSDQAGDVGCGMPHITLEWDNSKDKVVAAPNQVAIAWKDYNECSSSPQLSENGSGSLVSTKNSCVDSNASGVAEVLTVPAELLKLYSLGDILSLETWDQCLSEDERANLRRYLPSGVDADVAVSGLLHLENLHFGNPLTMWSQRVVQGDMHPDRVIQRDQANWQGRRSFFDGLRRYHSGLLETLQGMKAIFDKCKDPERQLRPQLRRWRNKRISQLAADAPERLRPFDEGLELLKRKREKSAQRMADCGALPEECVADANGVYLFNNQMYLRGRLKKRRVAASRDPVVGFTENGGAAPRRKQGQPRGDGAGASSGDNHNGDLMRVVKVTKEQMEEILRRKAAGDELRWDGLGRMLAASGGERKEGVVSPLKSDEERVRQHWLTLVYEDLPCAQKLIVKEQQIRRQLAKYLAEQCACAILLGESGRTQPPSAVRDHVKAMLPPRLLTEHKERIQRSEACTMKLLGENVEEPVIHHDRMKSPGPKLTGLGSRCTSAQPSPTFESDRPDSVSEVPLSTSLRPSSVADPPQFLLPLNVWQDRQNQLEQLHVRNSPLAATYSSALGSPYSGNACTPIRASGNPHLSPSSIHTAVANARPLGETRFQHASSGVYLQKHSLQFAGNLHSQNNSSPAANSGQHQLTHAGMSPLPAPFSKDRGSQAVLPGQAGKRNAAEVGALVGGGSGGQKSSPRVGAAPPVGYPGSMALDVGLGLRPMHPVINSVSREGAGACLQSNSPMREVGMQPRRGTREIVGAADMEGSLEDRKSPPWQGHSNVPRGFDLEKSLQEVEQEAPTRGSNGVRQLPQELQLFGPKCVEDANATPGSRCTTGNYTADASSQFLNPLSSACSNEKTLSTHASWDLMDGANDTIANARSRHKGPLQAGSYKLTADDMGGGNAGVNWHGSERRIEGLQVAYQKATGSGPSPCATGQGMALQDQGGLAHQIARASGAGSGVAEKVRQTSSGLDPEAKPDVSIAVNGAQQLATAVLQGGFRDVALGMRAPDCTGGQQSQLYQMQHQRMLHSHILAQQQQAMKLLAQQQQQNSGWPLQRGVGSAVGDSGGPKTRLPLWSMGMVTQMSGGGAEGNQSPASAPMGAHSHSALWAMAEAYQRTAGQESDRKVTKQGGMGGAQVASEFMQKNVFPSERSVVQEIWDSLPTDKVHGHDVYGGSSAANDLGPCSTGAVSSAWAAAMEIERFRTITSAGHVARGSPVVSMRQMLSHSRQSPLSRDMAAFDDGGVEVQTSDHVSLKYEQRSFDGGHESQAKVLHRGSESFERQQEQPAMPQDTRLLINSGVGSLSEREGHMLHGLQQGFAMRRDGQEAGDVCLEGEAEDGNKGHRLGNVAAVGLPQWMTASAPPLQHQGQAGDLPAAGQFYSPSSAVQAGWMAPGPVLIAPGMPDGSGGQGNWHSSTMRWPPQKGGGSSWA